MNIHARTRRPKRRRTSPEVKRLRETRERIEEKLEELLAFLDEIDGDPDLEPALGAAEQKAGGYYGRGGDQTHWGQGADDDREDDGDDLEPSVGGSIGDPSEVDLELDRSEDEPSLGSLDRPIDQSHWSEGGNFYSDFEHEHDGREPDADDEDSDPPEASDNGVADLGGLQEVEGEIALHRSWQAYREAPERSLAIDPALLPDRFIAQCDGTCLEPEIMDGARLEFDKHASFKPGDFVAVVRHPWAVPAGEHQMKVKRLVVDLREHPHVWPQGINVEMLNPPRRLHYLKEEVAAVFKVVRVVPEDEPRGPLVRAADLLAQSAQRAAGEARP